jgi:toxin CptA
MAGWMLLLAMALAALMGFAVQRGATCTVAAVDEVLTKRRAYRLLAMVEASLWVLGGLLLAQALGGHANLMPPGYAISGWVFLGAVLLGLGAAINGACVFGAIARFGSGQWSYSWTPVGFYLGCLAARLPGLDRMAPRLANPSAVLGASMWVLLLIAAWMLFRIARPLRNLRAMEAKGRLRGIAQGLWAPHSSTLVIGITFVGLLYLSGPWTYTDVLADWSRAGARWDVSRALLFAALLAGAVWGGWTAGRFKPVPMSWVASARSLSGGALMGLGSLLIPGGNDGLILTGMPLLWPHAWLAFATMFATIAVFLKARTLF